MRSEIHLNAYILFLYCELKTMQHDNKTIKQRRFVTGNSLRNESSIVFIQLSTLL